MFFKGLVCLQDPNIFLKLNKQAAMYWGAVNKIPSSKPYQMEICLLEESPTEFHCDLCLRGLKQSVQGRDLTIFDILHSEGIKQKMRTVVEY